MPTIEYDKLKKYPDLLERQGGSAVLNSEICVLLGREKTEPITQDMNAVSQIYGQFDFMMTTTSGAAFKPEAVAYYNGENCKSESRRSGFEYLPATALAAAIRMLIAIKEAQE